MFSVRFDACLREDRKSRGTDAAAAAVAGGDEASDTQGLADASAYAIKVSGLGRL